MWIAFAIVFIILISINQAMIRAKEMAFTHTTYIIGKGRHYSYRRGSLGWPYKVSLAPEAIEFHAMFRDGTDQPTSFINKLYGIAYGFDNHYNSVRVGWIYNAKRDKIELYAYIYNRGVREIRFMGLANRHEWIFVKLSNRLIEITLDDGHVAKHEFDIPFVPIRFRMFPYFGGKKASEKKVFISIQEA